VQQLLSTPIRILEGDSASLHVLYVIYQKWDSLESPKQLQNNLYIFKHIKYIYKYDVITKK